MRRLHFDAESRSPNRDINDDDATESLCVHVWAKAAHRVSCTHGSGFTSRDVATIWARLRALTPPHPKPLPEGLLQLP